MSTEMPRLTPFPIGGAGGFVMVMPTVSPGCTVVVETLNDGGGVEAGGGVTAGGSFGDAGGVLGATDAVGSGVGAELLVGVVDVDVEDGDDGAVEEVVPLAGCVVVVAGVGVVAPLDGVDEEVEPDGAGEVFGVAAAVAAGLALEARTGLAGSTAAVVRFAP